MFYRGKGDYHRLGHGTDDHVRRPRKVAALQGKKVICIATGKNSLHHYLILYFVHNRKCYFIDTPTKPIILKQQF